jgi:hypothetical protein
MPINLFNIMIAFGKMTQANSYWRQIDGRTLGSTAMTAKIVVEISDLPNVSKVG